MSLRIENIDNNVIRLIGDLDYENCAEADAMIKTHFRNCGPVLSLALDSIDYLDSCGLQVLIDSALDAKKNGYNILIVSMTPQIAHILQMSDLTRLFEISGDVHDETPFVSERLVSASGVCTITVPAVKSACRDARNEVANFVSDMGFSHEAVDDIKLAIGEALSNAVRHGASDDDEINIQCSADNELIRITMRYPSMPFNPESVPVPDHTNPPEGGMGIHFMRIVMDSVCYRFENGFVVLELIKNKS
ncbi:MAG: anti-sigma factor antagonist [Armatimonadota bacterium]